MDAAGAELVRQRIEEQAHWRQAEAVREGRQPASDPDRASLEEMGTDVRIYGIQRRHEFCDGVHTLMTYRSVKRLVRGAWERDQVVEATEQVA